MTNIRGIFSPGLCLKSNGKTNGSVVNVKAVFQALLQKLF